LDIKDWIQKKYLFQLYTSYKCKKRVFLTNKKQNIIMKMNKKTRKIVLMGYKKYENKDFLGAKNDFLQALYLEPNMAWEITYVVSDCFMQLGDNNSALKYGFQSYSSNRNELNTNLIAWLYYLLHDYQRAEPFIEESMRFKSDIEGPLDTLGKVKAGLRKYDEAKNAFQKIINISKDSKIIEEARIELQKISQIQNNPQGNNSDQKLLESFKKVIQMSNRVEIEFAANMMKIEKKDFAVKLFEWGNKLPFIIDGKMIVVENVEKFANAIDNELGKISQSVNLNNQPGPSGGNPQNPVNQPNPSGGYPQNPVNQPSPSGGNPQNPVKQPPIVEKTCEYCGGSIDPSNPRVCPICGMDQ
jgi:tetratricopeptide (TPR) repeat protein